MNSKHPLQLKHGRVVHEYTLEVYNSHKDARDTLGRKILI